MVRPFWLTALPRARDELEAKGVSVGNWRVDERDDGKHQVFFVVAPDSTLHGSSGLESPWGAFGFPPWSFLTPKRVRSPTGTFLGQLAASVPQLTLVG